MFMLMFSFHSVTQTEVWFVKPTPPLSTRGEAFTWQGPQLLSEAPAGGITAEREFASLYPGLSPMLDNGVNNLSQ